MLGSEPLSGADPVFRTEGGVILNMGPPDMTIQFNDPVDPAARQKFIQEVAEQTFQLNGIKRYWAGCDGTYCAVAGWGG